jgi:hypothetical protein
MSYSGLRLATVAVLLLAGCVKDRDSKRPVPTVASSGLAEKICSDCHEVAKLDRVHALLMLSAEQMPPAQVGVDAKTRGLLIRDFCAAEYGSKDADCIAQYLPPPTERLAVPMPVLLGRLGLPSLKPGEGIYPGEREKRTDPDVERQLLLRLDIESYARAAEPRNFYEPTLDAYRVAAAYLRCKGEANKAACIQKVMAASIEVDARGMVVK